jgi:peptide/nickel transport system ATP-binding protein
MLVEGKGVTNSGPLTSSSSSSFRETIVEVKDLRVYFEAKNEAGGAMISGGPKRERVIKAVDGVSLSVNRGEVISVVGESGSGKTTLGRAIVALTKPTSGTIRVNGEDVNFHKRKNLKKLWQSTQMIFQDPYSTFNPLSTVYDTLETPLRKYKLVKTEHEAQRKIEDELQRVGLNALDIENKYPNQLSGGQRQRISIARAMIVGPKMIIADEPVSMIDVSLRAGILQLLKDLNQKEKLTIIFITHDLAVAQYISDRIAVMYRGRIVEIGRANEVINSPLHPYTELLLKSAPSLKGTSKWSEKQDTVFRSLDSRKFDGCRFYPRCPLGVEKCTQSEPQLLEAKPGHFVSCYVRGS